LLPDLLSSDLNIIFCGTAAGTRSAAIQEYYAGNGNKFWSILYATGLTDRQLSPNEYKDLLHFRIGLTDLVKGKAGGDSILMKNDFRRSELKQMISAYSPNTVCFNGKKAAKVFFHTTSIDFGFQPDLIERTRIFVAPSTSGAANGYWDPSFWYELANSTH